MCRKCYRLLTYEGGMSRPMDEKNKEAELQDALASKRTNIPGICAGRRA